MAVVAQGVQHAQVAACGDEQLRVHLRHETLAVLSRLRPVHKHAVSVAICYNTNDGKFKCPETSQEKSNRLYVSYSTGIRRVGIIIVYIMKSELDKNVTDSRSRSRLIKSWIKWVPCNRAQYTVTPNEPLETTPCVPTDPEQEFLDLRTVLVSGRLDTGGDRLTESGQDHPQVLVRQVTALLLHTHTHIRGRTGPSHGMFLMTVIMMTCHHGDMTMRRHTNKNSGTLYSFIVLQRRQVKLIKYKIDLS